MQTPPSDTSPTPVWRHRGWAVFGVIAACGIGLVIARLAMPESVTDASPPLPPSPPHRTTLPTVAEKIPLRDSDPVIGVTLDKRYRAYLLADLWGPDRHIMNDLFDDVPVSVTFCNLGNCVRAFTDTTRGHPLMLTNGGAHPDKVRKMLLAINGRKFEQDTGKPMDGDTKTPFPYQEVTAVRTTWGEWRAEHPDSEVRANGRLYPPDPK